MLVSRPQNPQKLQLRRLEKLLKQIEPYTKIPLPFYRREKYRLTPEYKKTNESQIEGAALQITGLTKIACKTLQETQEIEEKGSQLTTENVNKLKNDLSTFGTIYNALETFRKLMRDYYKDEFTKFIILSDITRQIDSILLRIQSTAETIIQRQKRISETAKIPPDQKHSQNDEKESDVVKSVIISNETKKLIRDEIITPAKKKLDEQDLLTPALVARQRVMTVTKNSEGPEQNVVINNLRSVHKSNVPNPENDGKSRWEKAFIFLFTAACAIVCTFFGTVLFPGLGTLLGFKVGTVIGGILGSFLGGIVSRAVVLLKHCCCGPSNKKLSTTHDQQPAPKPSFWQRAKAVASHLVGGLTAACYGPQIGAWLGGIVGGFLGGHVSLGAKIGRYVVSFLMFVAGYIGAALATRVVETGYKAVKQKIKIRREKASASTDSAKETDKLRSEVREVRDDLRGVRDDLKEVRDGVRHLSTAATKVVSVLHPATADAAIVANAARSAVAAMPKQPSTLLLPDTTETTATVNSLLAAAAGSTIPAATSVTTDNASNLTAATTASQLPFLTIGEDGAPLPVSEVMKRNSVFLAEQRARMSNAPPPSEGAVPAQTPLSSPYAP